MCLQIAPDVFRRVEFRRVGRQELQLDVSSLFLGVVAHHAAAVSTKTVPDDQQLSGDLTTQHLEELDNLGRTNRAWKETEIELPVGDLGYPCAIAPALSLRIRMRHCAASRPAERPRRRCVFNAYRAPASTLSARRMTLVTLPPVSRTTAACDRPRSNSRPPRTRRFSSSLCVSSPFIASFRVLSGGSDRRRDQKFTHLRNAQ